MNLLNHPWMRACNPWILRPQSSCQISELTANDRNPSAWMAVWWTKTSSVPSSGTMNPKPFLTSNHLTVPDVMLSEKHRMLKGVLMASLLAAEIRLVETRAADLRMDPNMIALFLFDCSSATLQRVVNDNNSILLFDASICTLEFSRDFLDCAVPVWVSVTVFGIQRWRRRSRQTIENWDLRSLVAYRRNNSWMKIPRVWSKDRIRDSTQSAKGGAKFEFNGWLRSFISYRRCREPKPKSMCRENRDSVGR